jgi:predicted nucleic acid-binding Zn ribbon protein
MMGAMPHATDPAKHCRACGKPLTRKRFNGRLEDRTRFLKRIYCDKSCMAAGMTQPTVTLAGNRARAKKLRGDQCGECGATSQLHAHHIDGDPSNNDPANIETLCASCHLRWHWRHGKKAKPRAVCAVCSTPARKHGFCGKHYQRVVKYGDPLLTKRNVGGAFVLVRDSSASTS